MRHSRLMKTSLVAVWALNAIVSFAASQAANLSFETGGLAGWTVIGKAEAVAAKADRVSKGGNTEAAIEASSKRSAASFDAIDRKYDTILNITGTRFETEWRPNTISVIEQVLTFSEKSRLYVDANAFHNGNSASYAQIVLMDGSGNRITAGPGSLEENALMPSSDPSWAYEFGWRTFLLNVEAAGDYTIFASVFTYGSKDEPVAFKIDNIRWERDPDLDRGRPSVDEPIDRGGGNGGALIGAGIGVALLAVGLRRKG